MESVGNGFVVYGRLTSGSLWASMTFRFSVFNLSGARSFGGNVSEWRRFKPGVYASHSQAFSPRFVASPHLPSPCTSIKWKHLAYCLLLNSRFRTGDRSSFGRLHPTSSSPCWAYPVNRKPLPGVLKWNIVSAVPVTAGDKPKRIDGLYIRTLDDI